MARRTYATELEYAEWLGVDTAPAGSVRALAEATIVVDEMLLCARYDVDDAGMPTDPEHLTAVMEATCAQAAYARGTGDPYSTGAAGAWSSVSVGSASLSRGSGGGSGGAAGGGRYSPTARTLLQQAGLTGHAPRTPGADC